LVKSKETINFDMVFVKIRHDQMKIPNAIYSFLFLVFSLLILSNCKKQEAPPIVITGDVIEIDVSYVILANEVISNGGSPIIGRGVCWSMNNPPTITDNLTSDGIGIGSFTSRAYVLKPGSTYFFRAYAITSSGITYGEVKVVTTPSILSLSLNLKEAGTNYVVFDVEVKTDGGSPVTARGICWSTKNLPTLADNKTIDGAGLGSFTTRISDLDPCTTYNFSAYATNIFKTTYALLNFTVHLAPQVSTNNVLSSAPTTAVVIWSLDHEGVSPVTSQGVCWNTSPQPTITDYKTENWSNILSSLFYKCTLNGLSSNTTYYLRAFSTNLSGTCYGNEYSFSLEQFNEPSVSDIDGNLYHTVTIGTQVWMVENLKTARYRNGDPIPNVADGNEWKNLTTGAYCNVDDDHHIYDDYFKYSHGKLYNWYAVNDSRGIAPAGWHVPSKDEYITLINYLKNNGYGDVAKSLAAKTCWRTYYKELTDLATNNSSGFTGYPEGSRESITAAFDGIGSEGKWWTASESNGNVSFLRLNLGSLPMSGSPNIYLTQFKMNGFSVRCIKD